MKGKLFICFSIIWTCVIFYNSLFPVSSSYYQYQNDLSNIFEVCALYISKENVVLITSNLAHLFEFFILAILLGVAFSESGCHNALLFALASSLLIGNIDEGLQIFIRDRTSSVIDVFVDFAGACLGIVFLQFIKKHYRFRLIKIKD